MATSKLPSAFVPVPEQLIRFSMAHRSVFCNLRVGQRGQQPGALDDDPQGGAGGDETSVYQPVRMLLRTLKSGTRLAVHFQGSSGRSISTAVIALTEVSWSDGYPRLDFPRPSGFDRMFPAPDFWGGFILAVAPVDRDAELQAVPDPRAAHFINIVLDHGRPIVRIG